MALFFTTWSNDLTAIIVVLAVTVYAYVKYVYGYWQRKNVKFIQPTFGLGNFGPMILQKNSISELLKDLYHTTQDHFVGLWAVTRPMLLVKDPELIRTILVKDFQYFMDRGVYVDEQKDPLSGHLFSLAGDKWKNLRIKLSPVFTSGKLKAMVNTLVDCGHGLERALGKSAANNEVIEMREISACFTTNIIASVAFGNDVDCFKDPNTSFRIIGRKAFELTWTNALRGFAFIVFPSIFKLINLKSVEDDVEKFIFSVVEQTSKYRMENNVARKDLFQLLLQLKNHGSVQADGEWDNQKENGKTENGIGLTVEEMAAQVWVFFLAGFETSSTALSFCLYEMCKHSAVQRRAQAEIDEVLARHDGQLTYESMGEMKYLERCITETLRMYPSLPLLNRECTKPYKIPGTDVIIDAGTSILIPIESLQMDGKYFPNPEQFDPDRFLADEGKSFVEKPYFPFGDGPRVCIGMRLAKLQTKIGLIMMLRKFRYELADGMEQKLKMSPKVTLMTPIGGINICVKPR